MFNILKEECKISNNTNEDNLNVVQKLNEYFGHNSEYITIKSGGQTATSFGVNHYAGKVKYEANNMLNKCRDVLAKNVLDCMQKSEDVFVGDLFASVSLPNGSFSK